MKLYQRFGLTFSTLSLVVLVWNAVTPDNPDHLANMAMSSALLAILGLSCDMPQKIAQVVQVASMACVAFFPTYLTGEPFFGAASAVLGLCLLYVYGGYRTHPEWKFPVTVGMVFAIFAMATPEVTVESTARALVWTVYICVACTGLWMILEDSDARFHQRMKVEIDQAKGEIQSIKREMGGCKDGDA